MRGCALLAAGVSLVLGAGCGAEHDFPDSFDLNLSVTPSSLDFPGLCAGQAGSLDVTATHVGTAGTLHVQAAELDGLGPEFTLAFTPVALVPGQSAVVATVTFTPAATPGERFGTLVLHHDVASLGNVTRVPVEGANQEGDLVAIPDPINFEVVAPGQSRQMDVRFQNLACGPVVVNQVYLQLDGTPGFTIESLSLPGGTALPLTLQPGDALDAVLAFMPQACGPAASSLVVEGTVDGTPVTWSFDLLGATGPCPSLVVAPGVVDFQWSPPGLAREMQVVLSNPGTAALVIPQGGIAFAAGADGGLELPDAPPGPTALGPGSSLDLAVRWTPGPVGPADGEPLGTLQVASNDPFLPRQDVPVFGRPDVPSLVVVPELVDMGFGAQMMPVQRTLTLTNAGHAALHVASVAVVDPSRTDYGTEWQVARGGQKGTSLTAFEVPGNGSDSLLVEFTLRGPGGPLTATLRIASDDPARPVLDVPLAVQGTAP